MYVWNLPVSVDTAQNYGFQAHIVDLFIPVGSDGFTPRDGHGRVARHFYPVFEHRRLDGRKVSYHQVLGCGRALMLLASGLYQEIYSA
jgi:hypothetical protein